jgi:hypothetical protein
MKAQLIDYRWIEELLPGRQEKKMPSLAKAFK